MNIIIEKTIYYGLLLFALVSCISVAAQNVVTALLLLCFIIKMTREKKRLTIMEDTLIRSIAIFFAAIGISTIFSINSQTSAEVWINYFYRFSIFFVAVFSIRTRKQVQYILIALALSMSISDLYAIWQWLNGGERVSAFFRHPMILAGCLMLTMPILFVQVLCNREHRFIFIPALMVALVTLIFNQTRGAWIAIGLTIILSCILLRQYRKQLAVYTTGLLILLLLVFSLDPQLTARLYTIPDMQFQSNSERTLLWKSTIQMWMDYPITGIGLGNFHEQYLTNYISPFAREPHLAHAHNNVLHIFAETGILGGGAFLYMFYMILKTCYSFAASLDTWKRTMAITGILGTSALFLQGLTEYNFGNSVVIRLYWFTLGVLYASVQIPEE